MPPRLKSTGLTIAALVLSLTAPLLPTAYSRSAERDSAERSPNVSRRSPLPVFAQTSTNSAAKAEADRLLEQGIQQYQTSQFDAAFQSWQQALQIYRNLKDHLSEGQSLGNLGLAYDALGNYAKAIEYQQQSLAIARSIKNRLGEGNSLGNLGNAYKSLGNYAKAIEYYQQTLAIMREIKNRLGEGNSLGNLGNAYKSLGNYAKAIEYYQQTLAIMRETKNRLGEGQFLGNLGIAYFSLGDYPKAIDFQQQRLAIVREIKDRQGEGTALGNLGNAYNALGDYSKAIDFHQQSLAIAREIKDRLGEGAALGNLGIAYNALGDYSKAIDFHQQSLVVARQIKNRLGEGNTLGNLGIAYFSLGDYPKAIDFQQQRLAIVREIKDRQGEGAALGNLGLAYNGLGGYPKAIDYQQQSLAIAREIKDRLGEGQSLGNLGNTYFSLGDYPKAIDYHQQSLAIAREIKNRRGEGTVLGNLGNAYFSLGDYPRAIDFHQQSLAIAREIRNRLGEGQSLGNLGLAYFSLGDDPKAIDYQQKSLAIARAIKDSLMEGNALGNLGSAYSALGDHPKAVDYHQQSLATKRTIKDRLGEGTVLGNLGIAYGALGDYLKAIDYQQQRLAIAQEIKDRLGEGQSLGNLGVAYDDLGDYPKAIEYHEQRLAIAREIKDREGEGIGFSNLGNTLVKQQQPELAIIFYKQSVSVYETIRGDIRTLPRESQESYTQTVAGTYRRLADLLLAQGRVLEAQQVLELLKIQELRNYTRDTRAGGETKGASLNAIEAPVIPPFDNLIALGIKLTTCEGQKPYCAERDQLRNQRDQATAQFNQQADRLRTLARQGRDKDPAQLQQEELTVAAYKVVQAQPNTVLIYPLVLEDKLWLVYGLQAGKQGVVFASKEIPVKRKDLAATVTQFRQLLEDPNSDLKQLQQVSQKLYGWLVAPLRLQLDANGIQNLVFSLDRSTRYIPIAALHDGKQYLAQRFSLSTILTAGLTNTQDKLSPNLADNAVLGLGLSNAVPGFLALPHVVSELKAIVRTNKPDSKGIFQGTERLNSDFNRNAFKDILDYRILHMATHGKFDSEDPEKSFLVLGDGNHLKVTDIKKMNDLGGIHLVVLSACETAQGGPDKEGIEVSGLSYYFLTQNAKAVMASLWKVNDASTSQLMQQFYQNLATGKLTKAEALQQAQRFMLQGEGTGTGQSRGDSFKLPSTDGSKPAIARDLRHPYYWAPFILIGNSL